VRLQRVLDDSETTTSFRTTRRARVLGRLRLSLPQVKQSGDWRTSGGAELRVSRCLLDLVQDRTNQGDQEGRQRIEKRIGGEGVARAHRRCRNRPEMSAERRHFGERFLGG
jgi:hypothetical protein